MHMLYILKACNEVGSSKTKELDTVLLCLCLRVSTGQLCAEGLETFEKATSEQSTTAFRRDELPSSNLRPSRFAGMYEMLYHGIRKSLCKVILQESQKSQHTASRLSKLITSYCSKRKNFSSAQF